MKLSLPAVAVLAAMITIPSASFASNSYNVYITEFNSDTGNNQHFEFVELTNVGSTPVSLSGWSEDDSHATPNVSNHSLSGLGTLNPGQSGIFTEATPVDFRAYWGLSASVKVVGGYTNDNLSTAGDSIFIFDNTGTTVDSLVYTTTNGGTADLVSRNAPLSALGLHNNALFQNSFNNDTYGSYTAPGEHFILMYGNPGTYTPVPEPASLTLAAPLLFFTRRTKK